MTLVYNGDCGATAEGVMLQTTARSGREVRLYRLRDMVNAPQQEDEVVSAQRLVVGISGASGIIYGIRLLEVLRDLSVETHLIMSEAAKKVAALECGCTVAQVEALADVVYDNNADIDAPISSGTFRTMGMVVAPCAVKSLSAIAHSHSDTLLTRAADVVLKERRRLVLVVRETPLHLGHLRLMAEATEHGAVILPPMPSFYHHPKTIDDILNQTVGKILDQFDLDHQLFDRWKGGPRFRGVDAG